MAPSAESIEMVVEGYTSTDKNYSIISLYTFLEKRISEEQLQNIQSELEAVLQRYDARGTVLVACEGINGTISVPHCYQRDVLLELDSRFPTLRRRLSYHNEHVFFRLRVRVKPEIVTMGSLPSDMILDVANDVGAYVPPGPEWDALLLDPECAVIDTRNDYEIKIGTFHNAINPHTNSFTEFPAQLKIIIQERKPKKIAMFCTGGIRCEKATSYALQLIATDPDMPNIPVYHLEGGILAYLQIVPPLHSSFRGECYVFDRRTALSHGLNPSSCYQTCHVCRHPLTTEDRAGVTFQEGISCMYCAGDSSRNRDRHAERQRQLDLSKDKMHLQQQRGRPRSKNESITV
jgi:UPF0176 protein